MGGTASYLQVAAELGIVSIAVCLLMIGGEFDLSVGSMIGATGMIVALLVTESGWNFWPAMAVSLLFALPWARSMASWCCAPDCHRSSSRWQRSSFCEAPRSASPARLPGVPKLARLTKPTATLWPMTLFGDKISIGSGNFSVSIFWWIGLTIIATWLLLRTSFGNWIFGVGGSFQAARNVGVPVTRVKILLFMGTAASAWLVAIIQVDHLYRHRCTSRHGARVLRDHRSRHWRHPADRGLRHRYRGAFGALIVGMVNQGIVFAGFDADWFQVFLGGMLLTAVLVNRFIRQRATGARR